MVALRKQHISIDEYLAMGAESDVRHEYMDGEVYAMAGAKMSHNIIVANLVSIISPRALKAGCIAVANDMRVKTPSKLYAYPDVVMVCGKPQLLEEKGHESLLNPTLIIEVLSPTTEAFDLSDKFWHYRALPSLQEYILVAQDKARIERYVRHTDEQWLHMIADGLAASMPLHSLDLALPLRDVYEQVTFPGSKSPDQD
jgi:Uma2 family endonuclease